MRSQKPEGARNEQLLRVLAILREMHRLEGVDLYELADRHDTNIRTIRRDLDALEAAGIPMAKERDGKRMKWRVAYEDKLSSVASLLDVSHCLGLKLAIGQGGAVTKASGVYAGLEDLGDKIEKAVGSAGRKELEAIEKYFYSYEKFPYRESAKEYFWPLLDAMAESRVCRVIYRPPRPKPVDASYEILPLRMFQHDRAVYLICQFMSHGSVGTLNLQRLRDLKVLDRKVEPPKDFDPAKYEASAFGVHPSEKQATYVLRFDKAVAPYIRERVWQPEPGTARSARWRCGADVHVRRVARGDELGGELQKLGEGAETGLAHDRARRAGAMARRRVWPPELTTVKRASPRHEVTDVGP
jgi:predicted DNA-binding transcriptional regulator YafY